MKVFSFVDLSSVKITDFHEINSHPPYLKSIIGPHIRELANCNFNTLRH